MVNVEFINNKSCFTISDNNGINGIHDAIRTLTNLTSNEYYLTCNGRKIQDDIVIEPSTTLHLVLRLNGGKGGFGSMLRAIGAQIEKTTNREACRDLSGRRLRDINEEKRLKAWIAKQPEREREALEKKLKKIERLCQKPKHKFEDADYEKKRSELPDKVHSAVEEGFKVSQEKQQTTLKRGNDKEPVQNKKKPKLWIDADMDELSSDDDESGDESDKITGKITLNQPSTSKASVLAH